MYLQYQKPESIENVFQKFYYLPLDIKLHNFNNLFRNYNNMSYPKYWWGLFKQHNKHKLKLVFWLFYMYMYHMFILRPFNGFDAETMLRIYLYMWSGRWYTSMLNRDGCLKDFTAFSQLCIPSCKFFSKRTEKSVKRFIRKINFQTFKWCDGADITILYIYTCIQCIYSVY